MQEEHVSLETPEHVELQLELAGIGSRFAAAVLDSLLQVLLILGIGFVVGYTRVLTTGDETKVNTYIGIAVFASMLLIIIYYMVFEMLMRGQSPGKRAAGLVVVRDDGGPIGFTESAIRNILRIVDLLPFYYTIGMIFIFFTRRCKRLGDIAAGTIVIKVRDFTPRQAGQAGRPVPVGQASLLADNAPPASQSSLLGPGAPPVGQTTLTPGAVPRPPGPPPVDPLVLRAQVHVSTLAPQEIETLERFMGRRFELDPQTRASVAQRIADSLRPRFPGVPLEETPSPEVFLEVVWQARRGRG